MINFREVETRTTRALVREEWVEAAGFLRAAIPALLGRVARQQQVVRARTNLASRLRAAAHAVLARDWPSPVKERVLRDLETLHQFYRKTQTPPRGLPPSDGTVEETGHYLRVFRRQAELWLGQGADGA